MSVWALRRLSRLLLAELVCHRATAPPSFCCGTPYWVTQSVDVPITLFRRQHPSLCPLAVPVTHGVEQLYLAWTLDTDFRTKELRKERQRQWKGSLFVLMR